MNQKGGVGKTTTAVNLASYLAKLGKRVLLVDLDPQANATSGVGIDYNTVPFGLYEVLLGPNSLHDVKQVTDIPNLNLVPSSQNLAGANIELAGHAEREFRLHNELEDVKYDFDYIIIDSPPSLGLLTINGLVAAKEILIPVQCEYYALEGLGQLLNTVNLIKEHIKPDIQILGAVMTMYDERSKLTKEIFNELYRYFPHKIFRTVIPRNAKLAEAPFVKVEATRFTEVGYVGRDVEQIIRDLLEIAIAMEKVKKRKEVYAKAQKLAEEKVLDALVGDKASLATRESFRKRLRDGDLDDNEIEIAVNNSGSQASFEIPGMPGANIGMINIGEMIGKSVGNKPKKKKMTVKESHEILINDEADKLIEEDKIIKSAKNSTENNGIVFLDEIDKISGRADRVGGDVSREGVQRDLLPLIEGTTVSTKYGPIKTDHILFIASGAFQLAKPSDLLPELQGRLPIRVELEALNSDDFKRILKEPDYSLIKQYVALLKTENVELEFSDDGIDAIANIASEVNSTVENIGARRLHTIIERILDDISFTATDRAGEKIIINSQYVKQNLDELVKDTDLSKFIL